MTTAHFIETVSGRKEGKTMGDAIIKPKENEFITDHVTDELYKTIVSELSTRKKGEKTGKKITLTSNMLRDFLYYVSMGVDLKDAASAVQLKEDTRQTYVAKSPTFKRVSDLAKGNVSLRSRISVAKAIMGTKPGYYELIHPATQTKEYIAVKEQPPNVQVAMWWLEKVDKIGGDEGSKDAPQLGAPRNEEEAKLLEMLLNKHHDYIEAKRADK